MKIIEIREAAASIASSLRDAHVDFRKMTVSVVAAGIGFSLKSNLIASTRGAAEISTGPDRT